MSLVKVWPVRIKVKYDGFHKKSNKKSQSLILLILVIYQKLH